MVRIIATFNLSRPCEYVIYMLYINGLVQDCSNSSALAIELLQSCTQPSIYMRL